MSLVKHNYVSNSKKKWYLYKHIENFNTVPYNKCALNDSEGDYMIVKQIFLLVNLVSRKTQRRSSTGTAGAGEVQYRKICDTNARFKSHLNRLAESDKI